MTSLFQDLPLLDFALLVRDNPNLVHELNSEGATPLFVQTSLPYIRILARNGANLLHQDRYGDTVLHKSGNAPECILYLLRKADFVGISNYDGVLVEEIDEVNDAVTAALDPVELDPVELDPVELDPVEIVSFFADCGKCSHNSLVEAMTNPRYSTETISKLYSMEENPLPLSERTILKIIKLRGEEVLRHFSPPPSITRYTEQELLKKGYSQDFIDTTFTKANVVENDTCFCCLIDFETGDENVYLSCNHRVHLGCYKQVRGKRLRCFCGKISTLSPRSSPEKFH